MIKEIWETFHALLMGSDPDKLDEFISKYENCEIKSIRSFVEGLKMDIDAVKHAIELETSSGIVEGNNCKFKLLKRILFGRAGQDPLPRDATRPSS